MDVQDPPFRPQFRLQIEEPELIILMKLCWNEDHAKRPTLTDIKRAMKQTKWSDIFFVIVLALFLLRCKESERCLHDLHERLGVLEKVLAKRPTIWRILNEQ